MLEGGLPGLLGLVPVTFVEFIDGCFHLLGKLCILNGRSKLVCEQLKSLRVALAESVRCAGLDIQHACGCAAAAER